MALQLSFDLFEESMPGPRKMSLCPFVCGCLLTIRLGLNTIGSTIYFRVTARPSLHIPGCDDGILTAACVSHFFCCYNKISNKSSVWKNGHILAHHLKGSIMVEVKAVWA